MFLEVRVRDLIDANDSSWMLIASVLNSDFLGMSLKVHVAGDWLLHVSSVLESDFLGTSLKRKMKELVDSIYSSWMLIASVLESDLLGLSLKVPDGMDLDTE